MEIIPNINKFAEGSCLIRCGNTHVLCTACIDISQYFFKGNFSAYYTYKFNSKNN